jgi:hypothetical protein
MYRLLGYARAHWRELPFLYWGFLAGKLALVYGILSVCWKLLHMLWPTPQPFMRVQLDPFARDLGYTFAVLFFGLFSVALVYLAILDQRYRCRTCLRRLSMPLSHGAWHRAMLGPPRTDYICRFGHGTFRRPDVHLASSETDDWHEITDMWKELEETAKDGRER